jgi:hypothetical protein
MSNKYLGRVLVPLTTLGGLSTNSYIAVNTYEQEHDYCREDLSMNSSTLKISSQPSVVSPSDRLLIAAVPNN